MLNECYVFAHFVFNLFLPSRMFKVRLLMKLYHSSLYSKKSHFVFTPLLCSINAGFEHFPVGLVFMDGPQVAAKHPDYRIEPLQGSEQVDEQDVP